MANGRHRATRQPRRLPATPAAAVAAGSVALAGLAFAGLAAAPGASASPAVWDRVAACESSNNWSINTGNGFYGGLQFSASTWLGFHGGKYAARADLATRAEQIEVARRVLAVQGPTAWPVCGPRAGLSRLDGGATTAPLPDAASLSGGAHHKLPVAHKPRHRAATHTVAYRVRRGDTLARIAARHHVAGGWRALWNLNRAHVRNPGLIFVGQVLRLPA